MSRRLRHWILLTGGGSDTWILPEGDKRTYEIAPNSDLKRGDIVYLWWNPHNCFYGWGEVAETPQQIITETPGPNSEVIKKKRTSVVVNRKKEFTRYITAQIMASDRRLKRFIPIGEDDLRALELSKVQVNDLGDFIREHQLDAPKASATVSWSPLENVSDITVQAILIFGDKTNEGRLVEGVGIAWDEIVRIVNRDPEEIYRIDPRKFEELIAGAYERTGLYDEVILTPSSADDGRDVIATKHGIGSIRIYDQVKRYKISRPVTANDIRAIVGVLTIDQNVSKGIITTTSTFAPTLLDNENIRRLVPFRLELRPRDVLLPWLEKLRRR